MKSWAICQVIGSGTLEDPYRAAIDNYGDSTVLLPTNEDGTPKYGVALVLFDGDTSRANNDNKVGLFPNTAETDALTNQQVNAIKNKLTAYGLPTTLVSNGMTVGEAIDSIVNHLSPGFDRVAAGFVA